MNKKRAWTYPLVGLSLVTAMAIGVPAAAQYQQKITNNTAQCTGAKPAVLVTINGIKSSSGKLRVQSYKGTREDWLKRGRWLSRIEIPSRAGTVKVCMPFSKSGTYGIAVRHDRNGNGKTDLREDGGGMSNNPSINIWNLGKPSYTKTRFQVGNGVKRITINMRYM